MKNKIETIATDFQQFNFDGTTVRFHRDADGKPWFVAKDVCDYLGKNITNALRHLYVDDIDTTIVNVRTSNGLVQRRWMYTIDQSGLLELVLRSDKLKYEVLGKWLDGLLSTIQVGAFSKPEQDSQSSVSDPMAIVSQEFNLSPAMIRELVTIGLDAINSRAIAA